ncbi:MAG TPA: multidrug effflux MFS transporter [Pseudomonadales bacterium]
MSQPAKSLIFILAAIITIGPLSVDLYLPAMPSMVDYFATSLSQVQLTLSSYLLGFAVFHLLCGPLSDRYGRKPVLVGGLLLYLVMSVCCALATTVEQLVVWRFFQAMGACCAPTLGRAVVRDVYPPHQAVSALAYVSSLMALAPVVAPTLGGLLIMVGDWRLAFWVLAAAALVAIGLTLFCVPESLPQKQPLRLLSISRNYLRLLRHRVYIGSVLTSAFLYASVFAFLSGASFVLIDFLGVNPAFFGAYFLAIVAGFIGGNLLTARMASRWQAAQVFRISITLGIAGALALVAICLLQWYQPVLMVLPMFFVTLAIGLLLPQAMAQALQPFPEMAATASALMGFVQMGCAGLAGWLVGLFLHDQPLPMALVILGTCGCAAISYQLLLRNAVSEAGTA